MYTVEIYLRGFKLLHFFLLFWYDDDILIPGKNEVGNLNLHWRASWNKTIEIEKVEHKRIVHETNLFSKVASS